MIIQNACIKNSALWAVSTKNFFMIRTPVSNELTVAYKCCSGIVWGTNIDKKKYCLTKKNRFVNVCSLSFTDSEVSISINLLSAHLKVSSPRSDFTEVKL